VLVVPQSHDVQMHASQTELSRKVEWACDLHAAQVEVLAQDIEKQNATRKAVDRVTGLFTSGLLYVAIVAMWAAIALRYF
jgi:hypothetical protein